MKSILFSALALALALPAAADDAPKTVVVPTIDTVETARIVGIPESPSRDAFLLKVGGNLPDGSYGTPKLAAKGAKAARGLLEYEVTAQKSSGPATQALVPFALEATIPKDAAKGAKGVRVFGKGEGVRVHYFAADMVVAETETVASARPGQVVSAGIQAGVFPPFPSGFAVTIDGKPVEYSAEARAAMVNGRPVVGSQIYDFRFEAPAEAGAYKVVLSFKRDAAVTKREFALAVK